MNHITTFVARSAAIVAVLMGVSISHAQTGTLLGVDFVSGRLIELDPATGAGTVVGEGTAFGGLASLTFNPTTGALFSVDTNNNRDELVTIDPISNARAADVSFPQGPSSRGISALAFNATSETLFGVSLRDDELFTIDVTTGAYTAIGPLGMNLFGLAFDSTGTLFSVDFSREMLITIDPSTASITDIGPVGGVAATAGALTFDSSGTLFGIDAATDQLFTIDPTNGVTTVIGPHGFPNIAGLAFVPAIVPEPNTMALTFFALVTAASVRRRRLYQKTASTE